MPNSRFPRMVLAHRAITRVETTVLLGVTRRMSCLKMVLARPATLQAENTV